MEIKKVSQSAKVLNGEGDAWYSRNLENSNTSQESIDVINQRATIQESRSVLTGFN